MQKKCIAVVEFTPLAPERNACCYPDNAISKTKVFGSLVELADPQMVRSSTSTRPTVRLSPVFNLWPFSTRRSTRKI